MSRLVCKPAITDQPMPEEGARCMIYEDGRGVRWFMVNRAALLADPEGVFLELVEHCGAANGSYDVRLIEDGLAS